MLSNKLYNKSLKMTAHPRIKELQLVNNLQ